MNELPAADEEGISVEGFNMSFYVLTIIVFIQTGIIYLFYRKSTNSITVLQRLKREYNTYRNGHQQHQQSTFQLHLQLRKTTTEYNDLLGEKNLLLLDKRKMEKIVEEFQLRMVGLDNECVKYRKDIQQKHHLEQSVRKTLLECEAKVESLSYQFNMETKSKNTLTLINDQLIINQKKQQTDHTDNQKVIKNLTEQNERLLTAIQAHTKTTADTELKTELMTGKYMAQKSRYQKLEAEKISEARKMVCIFFTFVKKLTAIYTSHQNPSIIHSKCKKKNFFSPQKSMMDELRYVNDRIIKDIEKTKSELTRKGDLLKRGCVKCRGRKAQNVSNLCILLPDRFYFHMHLICSIFITHTAPFISFRLKMTVQRNAHTVVWYHFIIEKW